MKYFCKLSILYWSITGQQTFLVAQLVKNLPEMQETPVGYPGWEDYLEKGELPTLIILGFPGGSEGKKKKKKNCLQCRRPEFDPWVGKISWRRAWQPPPAFLPGESPWTGEPGGLQFTGSRRVGHD